MDIKGVVYHLSYFPGSVVSSSVPAMMTTCGMWKGVLQANGYPSKVAARHMKKRQRNQGSREDGKRKLFIPYVKGLSEMISRTCRKMNIETIFTKQRSLRSILSRPKQPQPTMDIKGAVYQIPCSSCNLTGVSVGLENPFQVLFFLL